MDVESKAELRLFKRLRDETDHDLVAFHSVAWLVPGRNGRPRQGEADSASTLSSPPTTRDGRSRRSGPRGPPIEQHFYATEEELLAQLDESMRAWTREAEVDPGSIALLTPRSAERSALWKVDRLGGIPLTEDPWDDRRVLRCSIYRFKGLERRPESARRRLPAEIARP